MENGIEVAAANDKVWITVGGVRFGMTPEQAVEFTQAIDEAIGAVIQPRACTDIEGVPV